MTAAQPPGLRLPPYDRELSPHTGYTRAHWEAAADGMLRAAWRWATPRGALLDLPGRASVSGVRSDGLEGYARTFLAAGFRVAGASGADPGGLLERYAAGLAAGTRSPGREDAESWPLILDHPGRGQPMVESASVALGLRLTRPWLWDRLDEGVRERAEAWLRGALRHTPAPNNWYLFPLTVAGFLESVGRGDTETAAAIERGLTLLEGWWRGEGWYADGDGRAFDHYNGWALHLYPVLHAQLAGDAALLARYGPRLREHLTSFGLMFGADGAPLYFGRSLTYRFAAGAAVALGALTGHTPLAPGVSRRLLSGALRYFLDRDALDGRGLLTLGWHGPHDASLQEYSGPASPYWASKGFAALLVPPDDPLWTAPEEPAPSEGPDRALAVAGPGLLLQSTGADGLVRLHNHGSDHVRPGQGEAHEDEDPLYARFAYSTRTGPTARDNVPDNHLALQLRARPGEWSVRRRIEPLGAASAPDGAWGWAASRHRPVFPPGGPPAPSLWVESVTVVRGRWEVRVHRVVGAPEGTRVRLTGWATDPDTATGSTGLIGSTGLEPLYGLAAAEAMRAPHGTAFTRWVRVPVLEGEVRGPGAGAVCAALAWLGEAGEAGPRGGAEAARPVVRVADGSLDISWAGGGVRLAFDPLTVGRVGPG
ncbi:DUF2264 domain-containing protein [Streptomyces sp. NBC_01187]|uniref:DUF2264 domain-containing protein n=1 Tax=Streptomyces sp. NBC_01187 TaxID=2903766 RepID=UPI003867439E|nr:DUF2264 domain-containing protein [Streptomyces sp. NBC_01187]